MASSSSARSRSLNLRLPPSAFRRGPGFQAAGKDREELRATLRQPAFQSACGRRATLAAMLLGLLHLPLAGAEKSSALEGYRGVPGQFDVMIPSLLSRFQVPGAAVAVVHRGTLLWSKGYGLANEARRAPVTHETVFRVASMSKPVAAWGVMRLAEMGKVDLDSPVNGYLTRWQLPPSTFERAEVTARRLLSHTAGLPRMNRLGIGLRLEEALSGAAGDTEPVRLIYRPGSRFHYSNAGFAILQLLVEEVSGEDFAAYMQREVLGPLGMTASAFDWNREIAAKAATGYRLSGQPVGDYLLAEKAAGGLLANAGSLARFISASVPGPNGEPAGRGLLAPTSLAQMFSPQEGTQGRYALGWETDRLANGIRLLSHSGRMPGWSGRIASLPDTGDGLVILTNAETGIFLAEHLLCAWCAAVAGALPGTICPALQALGPVTLASTLGLALGLLARISRLAAALWFGRRRWAWRGPMSRGPAATRAGLWWTLWYSDMIPKHFSGLEDFAPATLMPEAFGWLSAAVTVWCLLAAAENFLTAKPWLGDSASPASMFHRRRWL